ncbi:type IV pilus modification protein PilV [Dyella solisilvae]|uniref:Type IV pilus modification protein PilV n=1 Tax=Dyella solisilvae TaxID=1920168 RepID=A0A370KAR3_9GAMM|nr:type IV pilus modification protein PilV [Dyella solisilvae]RDI99752.1 type IV pilus modification protein PilV [Dyella solisilvae]
MDRPKHQRGVSLIEVLVAMFVFGIGLVGMSGLMLVSARSKHAAYLRTQVAFLANNMADRMRANPVGVWTGRYNGGAYPVTSGSVECDATTACSPDAVAARDKGLWSQLLASQLPDASAKIECTGVDRVGYDPSAQLAKRPPFGGTCTMWITWTEQGIGRQQNAQAATQSFAWIFQP